MKNCKKKRTRFLFFVFLTIQSACIFVHAQSRSIFITGKIYSKENKQALQGASVKLMNSTLSVSTEKDGKFHFTAPRLPHLTILFQFLGYKKQIRELELSPTQDSVFLVVELLTDSFSLSTIEINGKTKPDTVFGTPKYSIADFDFYEEKFILLCFKKNMNHTFLRLVDNQGKELSEKEVPVEAGEAKELMKDYMGYTNLICKNGIYRIILSEENFYLAELNQKDFNALLKPVVDTIDEHIFFTNYSADFPLFSYFDYNRKDSTDKKIVTVENKELMDLYRFEYYFLKPNEKLMARQFAQEYNIDKHKAAAIMSGFTQSMFYTPLYAPLFVIGDTLHVFDHYKNLLIRFSKEGQKIDSSEIQYHHPKKWREWKNHLLKDQTEETIYALFSKDGHQYLKKINTRSGKEEGSYKIIHYSAEKIKIKDNYLYYVYRPYESLQEKFLYKEKIVLKN